MRHLMSPLDFSVEELDQLLDLATDIEKHPDKYAHACDGKKLVLFPAMQIYVLCVIRRKVQHS